MELARFEKLGYQITTMEKRMIGNGLTFIGLLLLSTIMVACGNTTDTSEITVTNAWIRPGEIDGPPTAAYMVIRNTGDGADCLLSISADFSEMILCSVFQLHHNLATTYQTCNYV
ncbi:MAG: hypothetical protein OHK0046_38460 [Anaerolineae bacterium]|jgi:hypothetical protein